MQGEGKTRTLKCPKPNLFDLRNTRMTVLDQPVNPCTSFWTHARFYFVPLRKWILPQGPLPLLCGCVLLVPVVAHWRRSETSFFKLPLTESFIIIDTPSLSLRRRSLTDGVLVYLVVPYIKGTSHLHLFFPQPPKTDVITQYIKLSYFLPYSFL